ncbi:MmgE/PrpD family protein [Microvirga antarctica]|uniref:MmgE/PrpD family protein n=1 Tax=Microvirga antarctica TaxID=2819233 RepID=UPI001B306DCF|nr:MmgE/PrpD family protein [Microvirga antarctica]
MPSLDLRSSGNAEQTLELATFAANLRYDDLPVDVVAKAKACILDALGCCLAGVTQPWTRHLIDFVEEEGGHPRSRIIGTSLRTSVAQAALVGSTAGHGFEMDDIHAVAHLHAGSLTIPVALAIADAEGSTTGRALIASVVAGYEAGLRVGIAATGSLFMRGHHFQGTCGTFVAAATAVNALQLAPEAARNAFGVSGSFAAGLMAAQEGAMSKRLHAGHAAQMGVTGAYLARRGLTGISNILEAPYGGFLSTLSGAPDLDQLTMGLGTHWVIREVGFKPYPTAASVHSVLHAIDTLMRDHTLAADDIENLRIHCSTMAHRHCAWPYKPAGVTAAQMNMLFTTAMMIVDRAIGPDQFADDRLADPAILAMIDRVQVEADPAYDLGGDASRHAARVEICTRGGHTYRLEMLHRPGSPANPMSVEALRSKFVGAAASVLPSGRAQEIERFVETLEDRDARELTDLLVPATSANAAA